MKVPTVPLTAHGTERSGLLDRPTAEIQEWRLRIGLGRRDDLRCEATVSPDRFVQGLEEIDGHGHRRVYEPTGGNVTTQ